ncbi:hypothetical protein LCGC14_2291490 [marine sediment metagenome]|uniref:Uncharacterized protein n=1 Tax=marine sediment metagenome TaxID=412755 RepID=A0A0F9CR48_9ZZZZ
MTGKCEIYRKENGLEYVDFNPPYTEFSRFLYSEEHIIKTLKSALELRKDQILDKELIIKEFKRLIGI